MSIDNEVRREVRAHIELLSDALSQTDPLKRLIGVSSQLRYLVAHGQGNGWLLKMYEDKKFLLSNPIDENDSQILSKIFGVQGLPQLIFPNIDTNGIKLTLREIMSANCFYFRDKDDDINILNWDELISLIANKYGGQHSDIKRKSFVYEARKYQINGLTAVDFLLSWFAKFILQEVAEFKNFDDQNILFDSCSYYPNGKMEVVVQFRRHEATPIMAMSFDEKIPEYII